MNQSAPSLVVHEHWGAHDIADRPVVALDESPSLCWLDRLYSYDTIGGTEGENENDDRSSVWHGRIRRNSAES